VFLVTVHWKVYLGEQKQDVSLLARIPVSALVLQFVRVLVLELHNCFLEYRVFALSKYLYVEKSGRTASFRF